MELDLFFLLHFHAWTVETNAWMDLGIQVSLPDNGFLWICTQKWDWYGSSLVLLPWNQRSNCQHPLDHWKSKRVPVKHLLLLIDYAKVFDYVDHSKLWKILKEIVIPDNLTCLLRNLHAGQESTVRTGHGTTNLFQFGKGVHQGCILSTFLFNLYAEYIMRNARLDEAQVGISLLGEISITSDMQMTSPLWQKSKRNWRASWWKWKRRVRQLA